MAAPSGFDRIKDSPCILPISRVKTIMKSSPEVETVSQDALHIITKATELFIAYLMDRVKKECSDFGKVVTYDQFAQVINSDDILNFLHDMVPEKVTGLEALKRQKDRIKADIKM